MRLQALADTLGCQVVGDGSVEIHSVAGAETAGPGQLTFLANLKYVQKVKQTGASAVLTSEVIPGLNAASVISKNPYADFARALALFYQPPRPQPGIHPLASIAKSATLGPNCSVGPFAVVGEHVKLGANAILHPHVVIYEGAEIGDDFVAHCA